MGERRINVNDLPHWPLPERVSDIIDNRGSEQWGWVSASGGGLFLDAQGFLYVYRGAPVYALKPNGAYALLVSNGRGHISVWVPVGVYPYLRYEMEPDVDVHHPVSGYFYSRPEWVPQW